MNTTDITGLDDRERLLFTLVENLFKPSPQIAYWHHIKRVTASARRIAAEENANMMQVTAAALVHDVGVTLVPSFVGHIKRLLLLAPSLLREAGYSEDETNIIIQIAASHHPTPGIALPLLEMKVLFDADNLDIVGGFGSLRWFGSFSGLPGDSKSSAELFISIVKDCVQSRGSLFMTATGNTIGAVSCEYSLGFCKQVLLSTNSILEN